MDWRIDTSIQKVTEINNLWQGSSITCPAIFLATSSLSTDEDPNSFIKDFTKDVEKGDAEGFMKRLQSFLADFPYDQIRDLELHWRNVMFLVMKLMGFYVRTEYRTSDGRIDMVVKTDKYIYVMEFKLKSTSKAAMQQIKDKGYAAPFLSDGREVILI